MVIVWAAVAAVGSATAFFVAKCADNGLDGVMIMAAIAPVAGLISGALTVVLPEMNEDSTGYSWKKALLAAVIVAVLVTAVCAVAGVTGASFNTGRAI